MSRGERIKTALRDFGSMGLGFAILWHQAFVLKPGQANEWLLGVALTLILGPGVAGTVSLVRGGQAVTPGSESAPAPSPQQSSSQSSSSPGV